MLLQCRDSYPCPRGHQSPYLNQLSYLATPRADMMTADVARSGWWRASFSLCRHTQHSASVSSFMQPSLHFDLPIMHTSTHRSQSRSDSRVGLPTLENEKPKDLQGCYIGVSERWYAPSKNDRILDALWCILGPALMGFDILFYSRTLVLFNDASRAH